MKRNSIRKFFPFLTLIVIPMLACNALLPLPGEETQEPSMPVEEGFPDRPALLNDSGIEGVQTFPDKTEYHNHVESLPHSEGTIPPSFGQHYPAWQNCGIYTQSIDMGAALHSMEHGAVWLTYSPNLNVSQVEDLQDMVRGHDYVLMSPYPDQSVPVVMSAWTVQLVIESLPDDRIEQFIAFYANGPQNPEPGAPCNGAIGEPLP